MPSLSRYTVWFDPELSDVIALEHESMTPGLLARLRDEAIETRDVQASGWSQAARLAFPERYATDGRPMAQASAPRVTTRARFSTGPSRAFH